MKLSWRNFLRSSSNCADVNVQWCNLFFADFSRFETIQFRQSAFWLRSDDGITHSEIKSALEQWTLEQTVDVVNCATLEYVFNTNLGKKSIRKALQPEKFTFFFIVKILQYEKIFYDFAVQSFVIYFALILSQNCGGSGNLIWFFVPFTVLQIRARKFFLSYQEFL